MSATLGIKEQAVLISLLEREIARIEAQELAFKIQTESPHIYRGKMRDLVRKPTSEEIETKNICKKILDDVVDGAFSKSQLKEGEKIMRLKDKKTNGVLTVKLILTGCEGLEDHEVNTLYGEPITLKTLNKYCEDAPEEKKYGGRVPKRGDYYYNINWDGEIRRYLWDDLEEDKNGFECGNSFWTKEEAERELARREAYVILKEDTKGFKPDWKDLSKRKYSVCYDYSLRRLAVANFVCSTVSELAFATEEDARASIEAHSSEWKTWLGVEDE